MSKNKEIVNARKINMMRCVAGLITCSIVIVLTAVVLVLNIIDFFREGTAESGVSTLRMFTTISNIIALVVSFACLPYQIDGLRKNNYKLPNWIVVLMYVATTCMFLTFSVAISLITMRLGFYVAMIRYSNIFMHTLNPIFITLLFTLGISDYRIKFTYSFLPLIPVVIYALIYFIMVFVAQVWEDYYHTNSIIPWPVSLLLVLTMSFGITQLLRFLHNLNNKYVSKGIARYYKESDDYNYSKVGDAIAHLAEVESKFYRHGDDIYIPEGAIKLLAERYQADNLPLDIQYDIYLENYLKNIKENKQL